VTIDLKPEQQRVIELAVRSGAYKSPNEVLDYAFEIIREQLDLEDWMLGQRDEVAAHIAAGFSQAERGELTDGDAAVEILRKRRAERLKPSWMTRGDAGAVPIHSEGYPRP
jgi:Arc/MetJ-type ribon-helix-helix transcriptional regulator